MPVTTMCSSYRPISAGTAFEMSRSKKSSAALFIRAPHHSERTVAHLSPLQKYSEALWRQWDDFITSIDTHALHGEPLFLVYGYCKTKSWMAMVIENEDEQAHSISVNVAVPPVVSLSAGYNSKSQVTSVTPRYNYGPLVAQQSGHTTPLDLDCNQAVFLRRLARGNRSIWQRGMQKVALYRNSRRIRSSQSPTNTQQRLLSRISSTTLSPFVTAHGPKRSSVAPSGDNTPLTTYRETATISADLDLPERTVSRYHISKEFSYQQDTDETARQSTRLKHCLYTF